MNAKESALWPLSIPYGAAARLRAWGYGVGLLRRRRLNGNVISVGNLTVGGTGKTPMALWIAERLRAEGKEVAILTRGYRSSAVSQSDEVQLMKSRLGESVAIGVGPNRFANGRELASKGVDWFVLDDGFQHLQLARDADIVLIDALNPFGGGRLLPVGRMREPKTALRRADLIVITRSSHAPAIEAAVRRDSSAPIFYSHVSLESIHAVADDSVPIELSTVRESKWFAFCGIGNPSAFLADLRARGASVVGQRFFRDHHRYTHDEMRELAKSAVASGADGLICTEKDRFNLGGIGTLPLKAVYCKIQLNLDRPDEFWAYVQTIVASSRSKRL